MLFLNTVVINLFDGRSWIREDVFCRLSQVRLIHVYAFRRKMSVILFGFMMHPQRAHNLEIIPY